MGGNVNRNESMNYMTCTVARGSIIDEEEIISIA